MLLYNLRLHLHEIGSVWKRYEIGTDKHRVYTIPGKSAPNRFSYPVPNGLTYEFETVRFQGGTVHV